MPEPLHRFNHIYTAAASETEENSSFSPTESRDNKETAADHRGG